MVVFVLFPIAYVLFVLWLIQGWNRLPFFSLNRNKEKFSIIIAVRNEAQTITALLKSIAQQNYMKDDFEVIIVDDSSTDNTLLTIQQLDLKGDFKAVRLNDGEGKKAALSYGITLSKYDIIITTDADCVVDENWLNSINDCYSNQKVSMAFGAVTFYEDVSFFEKIQTLEFASLVGAGAASLGQKRATMCNGANLSFKKEAFLRVGAYNGNQQIASGDDEFLMHKLFAENSDQVVFNKSKAGIVKTKAAESFSQFINQRKRWASKWKHYQNSSPKILAPVVFFFNFYYLLLPLAYYFNLVTLELFITGFAAKITMDFIFISTVLRFLGKPIFIAHFLVLSLLYVFYVPLFGILGGLGNYTWKGRRIEG